MTQPELFRGRKPRKVRTKGRSANTIQRSLEWLRKQGYTAAKCEQYKPWVDRSDKDKLILKGGHKVDLFGFADILAFDGNATVAVQTADSTHLAQHLRLYREPGETRDAIVRWLSNSARRFVIHSWFQTEITASTGRKLVRWQLYECEMTADDLAAPAAGGKHEYNA